MRSLSVHPNYYNKTFYFLLFFFIKYKNRKIPSLSTKEKQNLMPMVSFLEKSLIYLLEHYYLLNTTLLNHKQQNTNCLELNQTKQVIFQICQINLFNTLKEIYNDRRI